MTDQLACVSRSQLGQDAWDAFADSSGGAWLWHTWDLQEALTGWPAAFDAGFAVVDSDGSPLAIVPLRGTAYRLARVLRSALFDSLGGPALRDDLGRRVRSDVLLKIRDELIRLMDVHTASEMRLTLSGLAPSYRGTESRRVNPMLSLDAENLVSQTWMLALDGTADELWDRLEGRARTAVRKARKEGVAVRAARADDLEAYFDLHRKTYARTGEPAHSRAYFETIWDRFLARGRAMVLVAEIGRRPVAAQSFALYKSAAAYWTGASSEEGLRTGANNLLQWSAIEWLIEHDYEWYEAGEAFPESRNQKLRGLSEFKRSTGGQLYPVYRMRFPARSRRILAALEFRSLLRTIRGAER